MSCVYVRIGAEANIDEVAKDLRNQAPWVLIVCCSDERASRRMHTALSQPAVHRTTRGDGGGGPRTTRGDGVVFQVSYRCVGWHELIIAGRHPVVKEIDFKQTLITPAGGDALIVEVGFHVTVLGQLSLRFAAFSKPAEVGSHHYTEETWESVAGVLEKRSVRVLAGEFRDSLYPLLAATRMRMTVNVCALRLLSDKGPVSAVAEDVVEAPAPSDNSAPAPVYASFMLVTGPVRRISPSLLQEQVEALNEESFEGEPPERRDASHGWPVFHIVKEKEAKKTLPHTENIVVFLESMQGHRSDQKKDRIGERARKGGPIKTLIANGPRGFTMQSLGAESPIN